MSEAEAVRLEELVLDLMREGETLYHFGEIYTASDATGVVLCRGTIERINEWMSKRWQRNMI